MEKLHLENPAKGVHIICADKRLFEDYHFVNTYSSRKKYISQISNLSTTKYEIINDMKEEARAFFI